MRLREALLNIGTGLCVLCAIAVSIGAYRNGAFSMRAAARSSGQGGAASRTPVPEWRSLLTTGRRIGPTDAALTIIEFGDFECPACASFARRLDSLRTRYPQDFAVVFHHLPLPYHKLAYPLARASECAAAQGKFTAFHDLAFHKAESLPITALNRIGAQVGVEDQARFDNCFLDTASVVAIDTDVKLAREIGVRGTPGIIIDGELLDRAPETAELDSLIQHRRRSRTPK
jgi:protein-disulfide isomerase